MNLQVICVALLAVFLARMPAYAEDFSARGPHPIETLLEDWKDAARSDRPVPVKIYYPTDLTAPAAVVVFSHGLGGSRDGYAYLGRHLASYGFIAVHPTHIGSDTGALRDAVADAGGDDVGAAISLALKKIASDPANILNRPKDISFVIDQLIELNKQDGPLHGKIDATKIGVGGHSFGAFTALAVAGQSYGRKISFRDDRVKAVVAMSPSAAKAKPEYFASIRIPMLLMTGTLDNSPLGGEKADQRRKVFEWATHCDRYLLVFDGGDHMVFSGRPAGSNPIALPGTGGDAERYPQFQSFVKAATLCFFNATLRGDEKAQQWLSADDGAKATLGKDGTWQFLGKGH